MSDLHKDGTIDSVHIYDEDGQDIINTDEQGLIRYKDGKFEVSNIRFDGCGLLFEEGKLRAIVGYEVGDENGAAIAFKSAGQWQPLDES